MQSENNRSNKKGQGLIEYALIIGLIAVVAIAALTASGSSIQAIWGEETAQDDIQSPNGQEEHK